MHITDSCPKALAPIIIPWGRGVIEDYIRVVGSGEGSVGEQMGNSGGEVEMAGGGMQMKKVVGR